MEAGKESCDLHTHSLFSLCPNGYTTFDYLMIPRPTPTKEIEKA
jgi:hypothetical protein